MSKYGPIAVLVVLFIAAFIFSPEHRGTAPVSAPLRTTPSEQLATRIFHGGPIYTMDGEGRVARALATRGSEIVAVGDERSVMRMLGPDTVVVDLRGMALVPGALDADGAFARQGTLEPGQAADFALVAAASVDESGAASNGFEILEAIESGQTAFRR